MMVNGPKIRELRERAGLTKEEFAGKFTPKVTRQAVELWESGAVRTFKTLNKIAEALKVKPERLIIKE